VPRAGALLKRVSGGPWRALVEHVNAMLLFYMLEQGVLAGVKEVKINVEGFILKGVKK